MKKRLLNNWVYLLEVNLVKTTKSKSYFKTLISTSVLFLLLLASTQTTFAQLDTEHYLPPLACNDASNGRLTQGYLYITNPNDQEVEVKVYKGTDMVNLFRIATIAANSGTVIEVLGGTRVYDTGSYTNVGLYVTSTLPIGVSLRASLNNQVVHLVSKGKQALGTTFRGITIPDHQSNPDISSHSSFVSVMAKEDGTTLTITPNGATPITVSLSAHQSYVIKENTHAAINSLLGALIQADKEIAVNVGSIMGSTNPDHSGANSHHGYIGDVYEGNISGTLYKGQDGGVDQIVPIDLIGKEYVVSRVKGINGVEIPVIVAHYNNTSVYLNGASTPIAILSAGEWLVLDGDYATNFYDANGDGTEGDLLYPDDDGVTTYNMAAIMLDAYIRDATGLLPPYLDYTPPHVASVGDVGNGLTSYTEYGSMYIRTSTPSYLIEVMSGDLGNAQLGMFYVPPLICSAPRDAYIPQPHRAGQYNSINPGLNILTRAEATVTIGGQTLESLLAAGTVLNYETNNINGRPILGYSDDFVTYQITFPNVATAQSLYEGTPLANSYLHVQSTGDLYLAAFGYSSAAGHGGYYSGFEPTFEITNDADCFPVTLTGPDNFDEYQWYRDGAPVAINGNLQTYVAEETEGTHYYYLAANYSGCDPIISSNVLDFTAVESPVFSTQEVNYCTLEFTETAGTVTDGPTVQDMEDDAIVGLPVTAAPGEDKANNLIWYEFNPTDPAYIPNPGAILPEVDPNPELLKTDYLKNSDSTYYVVYQPSADPCFSATPLAIHIYVDSPTDYPVYTIDLPETAGQGYADYDTDTGTIYTNTETADIDSNLTGDETYPYVVYCATEEPTISLLNGEGLVDFNGADLNVVWYTNSYDPLATGEASLSSGALLEHNKIYWAASYNDGVCEYTNRLPVKVKIEGELSTNSMGNIYTCNGVDVDLTASVENTSAYGTISHTWEYTVNGTDWTTIVLDGTDGTEVISGDVNASTFESMVTLNGSFIDTNETNLSGISHARYRMRASLGACGTLDTDPSDGVTAVLGEVSTTATLYVDGPIEITRQPFGNSADLGTNPLDGTSDGDNDVIEISACGGEVVQMKLEANSPNNSSLSYVWQQRPQGSTNPNDWVTVSAGQTYLVTVINAFNNYEFRGVASSDYCNDGITRSTDSSTTETASKTVTIVVEGPVQIEQTVANATTCVNGTTDFIVVASTGESVAPAVYIWQVNLNDGNGFVGLTSPAATTAGVDVVGTTETEATLSLQNVPVSLNGAKFRVSVTTAECTSATTSTGTLVVEGPLNDVDVTVTASPADYLICEGDLLSLSAAYGGTTEGSLSYTWQESSNGGTTWVSIGTGENLLLSNVSSSKDGHFFRVMVETGSCVESDTNSAYSTGQELKVTGPLFVTDGLESQTICVNEDLILSVTVDAGYVSSPDTDLQYTWEKRVSGGSYTAITAGELSGGSLSSNTITLSAAAAAANGNSTLYRVSVNNAKCSSPVTSTALITLEGEISFTAAGAVEPVNQTICAGESVSFTGKAVINPSTNSGSLSYLWEQSTDSGSTWSVVGTGLTLVLSNVQDTQNGVQYRMVASTANCDPVTSAAATLTVEGPITVTTEPQNQTVCYDGINTANATFSIVIDTPIAGIITNQWYNLTQDPSRSNILSTTNSVTLTGLTSANDGDVIVVDIQTSECNTVSYQAQLFVQGAITVTTQPVSNPSICEGGSVAISASFSNAGSGGVNIQWFVDKGTGYNPIAGATSSTYFISGVDATDNGNKYKAVASTNTCGDVQLLTGYYEESAEAILTVSGGAVINQALANQTTCADSSNVTIFTVDAALASGTATFTWYIEDSVGSNTFTNEVPLSLTVSGDNNGHTLNYNELHLVPFTSANIVAYNGRKFRVEISAGSSCGSSAVQSTASLFIEGPITVLPGDDPQNATICVGGSNVFSVTADDLAGAGTLSYEWQVDLASDGANDGNWITVGTGSSYAVINASSSQNGNLYRVKISSGGTCEPLYYPGGVTLANWGSGGTPATLNVEGPITLSQEAQDVTVCLEDGDFLTDATLSQTANFTVAASAGAGTPVYNWEYSTDGGAIWNNIPTGTGGDPYTTDASLSSLDLSGITGAHDGYYYRVSVTTGQCSEAVTSMAQLHVEGELTVTTEPTDLTVCSGGTAIFDVAATTESGSITYLWEEETTAGSGSYIPVGSSATYVKSNVSSSDDTKQFRVTVSTGASCTAYTKTVTLTVDGPITITDPIDSVTLCDDGSGSLTHTFTVGANVGAGNAIYAWYKDGSATALVDGSGISGATTASLTVPYTSADNGAQYTVEVSSDLATCGAVSSTAYLTVEGPITIDPPASTTMELCYGSTAVFEVTATEPNGANLTYVWQSSTASDFSSGVSVVGGGSPVLTIPNITDSHDQKYYRAKITTSTCTAYSTPVQVSVDGPVNILSEPMDVSICANDSTTASFTVNASTTLGNLQYQWYEIASGTATETELTGETNATLNLTGLDATYNGNQYKVYVTTDLGYCTAQTATALLTVEGPVTFSTQPTDQTVCDGESATFTANATANGAAINYVWESSATGAFTGEETIVGSGPVLTVSNTASVATGTYYRAVASTSLCNGVASNSAQLLKENPLVIDTELEDVSICDVDAVNDIATYTVAVSGVASPTYTWYKKAPGGTEVLVVTGDTSDNTIDAATLNVIATAALDGYTFRVQIDSGGSCGVGSSSAKLFVEGPITFTAPTDVTVCAGSPAIFNVSASTPNGDALSYIWQSSVLGDFTDAVTVGSGPVLTVANTTADKNGLYYRAIIYSTLCTVYTATSTADAAQLTVDGSIKITTELEDIYACDIDASTDQVTFVVTATVGGNFTPVYTWYEIDASGSESPLGVGTNSLDVNIEGKDGFSYRVEVTTDNGTCEAVSSTAYLNVEGPITISSQPTDQAVCAGGTAIFQLAATEAQGNNLIYVWESSTTGTFTGEETIAGGGSPVLTVSNVSASQNGLYYRAKLSTAQCETYSDIVQLTVDGPIIITNSIDDVSICDVDGQADNVTFEVTATTTNGTLQYAWYQIDTNGVETLLAETSNILTVDATYNENGYTYRVDVTTDLAVCSPVSSSATLDVEGPITINVDPQDDTACAGSVATFDVDYTIPAGGGTPNFIWERISSGESFATDAVVVGSGPTYTTPTLQASDNGNQYRVRIATNLCEVISAEATLTVDGPIVITTPLQDVTVCDNPAPTVDTHTFTVTATTGASTPTYTWYEIDGGGTETDVTSQASGNSLTVDVDYTKDGYQYKVVVSSGTCSTVESIATLNVEGPIEITLQPQPQTLCAGSNAMFEVAATIGSGTLSYQWQRSIDGGSNWISVGNATNSQGLYVESNVSAAQNGYMYRALVSAGTACTPLISDEVVLTVEGPIVITQEIDDVLTCDGEMATFEVGATAGVGSPLYQWQESTDGFTWTDISGETNSIYSRTAVSTDDGLLIRVQVSTTVCTVEYSQAVLNVDGPISIIEQPEDYESCEGSTAIFKVAADGNGTSLTYEWEESTDGGATWAFAAYGPTFSKPGLTIEDNGNLYRVSVYSEGCSAEISNEVTLTVQGVPFVDSDPVDIIAEVESDVSFTASISNVSSYGTYNYQWQVNDGTGWIDIVDDATYSGATTTTLSITSAPYIYSGNKYRLRVETPDCNLVDFTNYATLTLDYDCDGDGMLNYIDPDDDNDGIIDTIENYGQDVFGDHDNDGVRNFEDADFCTLNAMGACEFLDLDGDGIINQCDTDSDGNGVPDTEEAITITNPVDTDGNGVADFIDFDNDGNGILDIDEIGGDPLNPIDTDGDGVADYNDLDNDGDSIPDVYEIYGDPSNPIDTDGDGTPDYLDEDSDGDTILDSYEAGADPEYPVNTDADIEEALGLPFLEDYRDTDSDNNGISDQAEAQGLLDSDTLSPVDEASIVDTDGDGTPDYLDFDNDGDSLWDTCEIVGVAYNGDTTCDGIFEVSSAEAEAPVNSDAEAVIPDNIPDYMDSDDDNDEILTIDEDQNGNNNVLDDDCDRDGVPDYIDVDGCDDLVVPNGFTPNGDGIHETFVIPYLYDYPNFEMEIFDRRGNKMYSYKDDGNPNTEPLWWDGTLNNKGGEILPSATYFYIIKFNKSQKEPKTGWVYLLK